MLRPIRCAQPRSPAVLALLVTLSASSGCTCDEGNAHDTTPARARPPGAVNPPGAADAKSPVRWAKPVVVATGGGHAGPWRMNDSEFHYVDDPTVAVHDDGSMAVAWANNRRLDVYFRAYGAGGSPQGEPTNVSRNPETFSWLPRAAIDGGRVYLVWQEIIFSGGSHGGDAMFARSTDGGRTFEAPVNLSGTPAGAGKGRLTEDIWDNGSLDLAVGPHGVVYVAWTEYEGPLRLAVSVDRGATFGEPVHVAGSADAPARAPSLTVAPDGTVHLAWTVGARQDADIHFATADAATTDRRVRFGEAQVVERTDGHSDAPAIAVGADGTLHLAYGESPHGMLRQYHVRYLRRPPGEARFSKPRVLSRRDAGDEGAHFPTVAVDGDDRVHVVWEHYPDYREPPDGLGHVVSTDGGESFSAPHVVSGTGEALPGINGSLQGKLSRKLDVSAGGAVAVVNAGFDGGEASRVVLVRGVARRD